jgi:hypothetical protein
MASAILMYFANRLSATFCATSNLIVSLPPPALGECCHGGLARRRVAVRRRAVRVVPVSETAPAFAPARRKVGVASAYSAAD